MVISTQIYVQAKKHRKGNFNSEYDGKAVPVNNFLHSLFEMVSVQCKNKEKDNTDSQYAYKSYVLDMLNSNHETKNTLLSSSLFYKDTAGEFNNFVTETKNVTFPKSLCKRRKRG